MSCKEGYWFSLVVKHVTETERASQCSDETLQLHSVAVVHSGRHGCAMLFAAVWQV